MFRLALVIVAGALASTVPAVVHAQADQRAAAATVRAFHEALARGDSVAALELLAPDALILESGGLETRDEYRAHHLPGDIAFARAAPSQRGDPTVTVMGDVAWVVGTSRTTGTFRDRPVNSTGAELVVLSRDADGWRIRAIHWSSRAVRSP